MPTIYELALRHPDFATTDVSSVRTLSYGGAPIAPELVHRLLDGLPAGAARQRVRPVSETSALATFLPHEYAAEHADVRRLPDAGERGADRPARRGSGVGELLIRGPNVVAGYWGDPARTAETFVDGWLHTGDVARDRPTASCGSSTAPRT